MADDLDSFDVGQIQGSWALKGLGEKREQQKKDKQHQQSPFKESKDYVHTITKAAEASNEKLVRLNLPYRFSVYSEGEEVFIEIVVLDENGKTVTEKKKNISHDEFARLIEDVSQIEGLFFDTTA
jgi:uncharacterized FlaG/YvyC family protein